MVLYLETILLTFLSLFLVIFLSIYLHQTKNYGYWKSRGVPHKKPVFPFGSTKDLVLGRTYIGKGYDTLYKEFLSERYFGIVEVQNPVLVLRDPELIKSVLVKDFDHFTVRTFLGANPKEYILRHVINMSGQEWKEMRTLLTPAFTSGKMKLVFILMEKCSEQLCKHLLRITEENSEVEITNLFARFTMDIIATSAFGLETDSINNEYCPFFLTVGAMLKTSKARFFRRFLINFFPTLVKFLPVKLIPPEVTEMLTKAVRETVTYREETKVKRNDFLDILIKARHNKTVCQDNGGAFQSTSEHESHKGLTVEQMTAQAFVFFIAGYTTDTSILSFCLYELARDPIIQYKLHQDIQNSVRKHRGKMSFQALHDMSYMDQVINEALRLYGSGQILIRTCTKSYKIPESDLILEKGVRVIIPTYSLHHDPKYFSEPYEFKPERFTQEKVKGRHPCVFLPFGEGPRNCIGRNFGLLQIKIGLATVISEFKVELSPKQEVPIEIDKRCIVITPANPVLLNFTRRRKIS